MKKALLAFLGLAFLCMMAADASATKHGNNKWALHDAGTHDAKTNTCAFSVVNCSVLNVDGPSGPARNDIYIMALDTKGIAGTRYGLCCDGSFWFYGWTSCSDFEITTAGWPGCGEGNAQTWSAEQPIGHVTVGILDVYVYPSSAAMWVCDDPRKNFAEWCDGSAPEPICEEVRFADFPEAFGIVDFNGGEVSYNPCGIILEKNSSWGAVKALYR